MPDPALEATKITQTESLKFDYFVCGVVGAIFAYIIKDYSPHKIGFNVSTLETASLVLLAASFYAGIKRIEHVNELLRINRLEMDVLAKVNQAVKAGQNPAAFQHFHAELEHKFDLESAAAGSSYTARQRCLIFGFAAIFFAKVLQPYEAPSPVAANGVVPPPNTPRPAIMAMTNQGTNSKTPLPPDKTKLEPSFSTPLGGTNGGK